MDLREKAEQLSQRVMSNPFAALYAALGIVGTIWGAAAIYAEIAAWIPPRWTPPVNLALTAVLLLPAVAWWLTSYRRRYGISITHEYFFPQVQQEWCIKADGSASITKTVEYYFLRDPRNEDMVDNVFGSAPHGVHELNYASPDSSPTDYRVISKHRHLVYWKPHNEIKLGVPYTHVVGAEYPYKGPLPVFKSLTIAPHARTLRLTVHVRSELRICEAIAYQGYRFQRNKDAQGIAGTARRISHRRAPLPVNKSPNEVQLTVEHVQPGTTYYLVLFFEHHPQIAAAEEAAAVAAAI
ncbi:MAG TPA: hypothetical protein VEQ60_00580 [Longimicrobium sp.]|nr:hypothetical protein [Longimicrobium sp.]